MPELPEVEGFRRLLLPMIGQKPLSIELLGDKPPRKFLGPTEVSSIHKKYCVQEVLRKGKIICMMLCPLKSTNKGKPARRYLFLHMGMTGRISTPDHVPKLERLTDTEYPPPHTYLKFMVENSEASFSDPRKFGSAILADSLEEEFGELAVDGMEFTDSSSLVGKNMRIKALLLDQKRAVSGVGNWVADEVLYQAEIHPDQTCLTEEQGNLLQRKLIHVLTTAITSITKNQDFPSDWLFSYRWNKRAASHGGEVKDSKGRKIEFIKTGGRTSALVPSVQKLEKTCQQEATTNEEKGKEASDVQKKRKRKTGTSQKSSRVEDDSHSVLKKQVTGQPGSVSQTGVRRSRRLRGSAS